MGSVGLRRNRFGWYRIGRCHCWELGFVIDPLHDFGIEGTEVFCCVVWTRSAIARPAVEVWLI